MINIIKKIAISGNYAVKGIRDSFREEFMVRVQFSFGLIQFLIVLLIRASFVEVIIIFALWINLVSQEIMNTGIENLTNLVTGSQQELLAKRAKDSAAGSVMLLSITSWIIFLAIFFTTIYA